MIRGIYIAASSAISDTKRIDVLANNIANINTAGFKKDQTLIESFPDVLVTKMHDFPDKDVLKNRGASAFTTESQDDLTTVTANAGFFNVQTPTGISRGKSVSFRTDENGYLTTPQGNYILGLKGPINTGGAAVTVDNKGQVMADGAVIDRLKVSNPLNVIGNLSYGVRIDEVFTDFTQGQLTPGGSFDLAIQGKGFFAVETPAGERYTRDGEFTKDANGFLVTKEGYSVLGENGPIQINGDNFSVNATGEVAVDGDVIDTLKLTDFEDYKALRKDGNGLYEIEPNTPVNAIAFSGAVNQGFVESSNVNSVREMVDMMTVMRSYEANQKVIKIHDELLGKAVNDIARV